MTYPFNVGHQGSDTSRDAADSMESVAGALRAAVLDELHKHPDGMTADECAAQLNASVLGIRPRFTELLHLGCIEDSGERRKNKSGRNAAVWIIAKVRPAQEPEKSDEKDEPMVAITKIKLASDTVAAIYAAYKDVREDEERTYLGASVIGDECWRKLWYSFRWAAEPEEFDGRMLRLFDTGHREEARMIDDLRLAGVEVWDRDPDDPEKQIGVVEVAGHFRGHLDAIALGVKEAPKTAHVVEAKTHSPKSFKKLKEKGVRFAKPEHYAQMQIYMHLLSITRALYIAYGKHEDDENKADAVYGERINYDPVFAAKLIAKAQAIITAYQPPPKLHKNPDAKMAWNCTYCAKIGICHKDEWPRRNCRTCIEATPEMNGDGRWSCALHKRDLTRKDQQHGCCDHRYIPEIVPGQQVDCDLEKRSITYALNNGTTWIDGE